MPATHVSSQNESADTTLQLQLRKSKHASRRPLPSDAINKGSLQSIEAVLLGKSVTKSVAPTITQLLTREAFFSESILAKSVKVLPPLAESHATCHRTGRSSYRLLTLCISCVKVL